MSRCPFALCLHSMSLSLRRHYRSLVLIGVNTPPLHDEEDPENHTAVSVHHTILYASCKKSHHFSRSSRRMWNSSSHIAEDRSVTETDTAIGTAPTQFHIREEAKRASTCARLDEADDIYPQLHVLRRRPRIGVHEESQENTHVYSIKSATQHIYSRKQCK